MWRGKTVALEEVVGCGAGVEKQVEESLVDPGASYKVYMWVGKYS
jgi:hypothetical protein